VDPFRLLEDGRRAWPSWQQSSGISISEAGQASSEPREERKLQQVESKLKNGQLDPAEFEFKVNHPVQWLIHRFDSEPDDEIFEIEELDLYELLPAGHTTVFAFYPRKRQIQNHLRRRTRSRPNPHHVALAFSAPPSPLGG
jgi:hypothetical protein